MFVVYGAYFWNKYILLMFDRIINKSTTARDEQNKT